MWLTPDGWIPEKTRLRRCCHALKRHSLRYGGIRAAARNGVGIIPVASRRTRCYDPPICPERILSQRRTRVRVAKRYDAVIVGGGHNGLVAACYLAEAGISTLVLERYRKIGGAAISEEYVPGFTFSTGSYVLSLMPRKIVEELRLLDAGVEFIARNPRFFAPFPDGSTLSYWNDHERWLDEIRKISPEGCRRLRPLRRHARKGMRSHGSLHPPPAALLERGRGPVPHARGSADLPEVLSGFGRRYRRVLLRKRADAGGRRCVRVDRHLPRTARHRHRLRQALSLDGHGHRSSRSLDLCQRRHGIDHAGALAHCRTAAASKFASAQMSSRSS